MLLGPLPELNLLENVTNEVKDFIRFEGGQNKNALNYYQADPIVILQCGEKGEIEFFSSILTVYFRTS
jgi:hypothetical protein